MIRHLVAVRFRAEVSTAEKEALYGELAGLRGHLDGVLDFQHRRNASVEDELVRGFRDVFWFDFRDAAARDAYLADAAHQAVGARIVARTEGGADGIFVVDFEV